MRVVDALASAGAFGGPVVKSQDVCYATAHGAALP
jgi:hypothetical protein